MKITSYLALMFVLLFSGVNAQGEKNAPKKNGDYPETFSITKAHLSTLLDLKINSAVKLPENKYIDQAVVLANVKNGDMQFMKLKLAFFPNSSLMIQVNGEHSTQVFLLSDDQSLSYKGAVTREQVTLTRCKQDEIVSE